MPAATPTTAPTPTPPAVSERVPEGTLVIAVPNLSNESWNTLDSSGTGRNYFRFVLDVLVGTNADAELDKNAGLANDWEMSPDGMKWTFRMRKGISFSNGDPVTAEDTKFTLAVALQEDSQSSYKTNILPKIGTVDNFVITDPYTVVFNHVVPSPLFIWNMSDTAGSEGFVRPKKYTESLGTPEEYPYAYADAPVGSGPYLFARQRVGSFMEFEADGSSHWRDGVPKFKTVTFRIIPEEATRIAALQAGEIDVASIGRERLKELENEGFRIFRQEFYSAIGFFFHENWIGDTPFADINFRKAANLAINREEIAEFLFAGAARNTGCWPQIAPSFPQDLEPYPYDVEGAKAALAASSYDGREIVMHAFPLLDTPEAVRMAETLQGYLIAVGINLKVNPTEYARIRGDRQGHKLNDQMTYFSCHNRTLAAMVGLMRVIGHSEGSFTATADPVIDQFIETMEQTLDDSVRQSTMTEYIRYVHENYWYMHVVDFSPVYATSQKVETWNPVTKPDEQNYLNIAVAR